MAAHLLGFAGNSRHMDLGRDFGYGGGVRFAPEYAWSYSPWSMASQGAWIYVTHWEGR